MVRQRHFQCLAQPWVESRDTPYVNRSHHAFLLRRKLTELPPSLDVLLPSWQSLPEFLGETKYRNPIDATATPFQKGHKTDLPSFQWLQKTPAYVSNFGLWMGACRKDLNNCFDTFPFEKEVATNIDPQTPLFVDVGGGVGFQCVALREKLPHLAGRVALQDLQQVIEIAIPAEGVETMVHNFRDEKPVKGKDSVV